MIFLFVPILALLAALLYEHAGAAYDRRLYRPPGRLVDVNGTRWHLHEQGHGNPVVVFESGIGASSLSWSAVQPKVAAFTRTVSYDRAGLGWSDLARSARSAPTMVDELRGLLSSAAVPGPYILVGHSFGALLARVYASLYPRELTAVVLIDPVSIAAWANCPQTDLNRLHTAVRLAKRGAWAARFGLVRGALAVLMAGGRRFPRLAARVGGKQGATAMLRLIGEVRKMPVEVWPIVRAHWSDPKCFRSLAEYLSCLPESAMFAALLPANREVATVILSASTATVKEIEERDRWLAEAGSGKHIRMEDCGHWIQLDHPDFVVEIVRDVVDSAKRLIA